jgi:hypothetical protein
MKQGDMDFAKNNKKVKVTVTDDVSFNLVDAGLRGQLRDTQ